MFGNATEISIFCMVAPRRTQITRRKLMLKPKGRGRMSKLSFPAWPQFDDAERAGLLRALEQGQWWRIGGDEVRSFEREFARHHGAAHALAVTNGTQALQLGLEVLGLTPGDEVLVPAFTFL